MTPKRKEIDHRTIKLIVGVIAIGMPITVAALSGGLPSISDAYYQGGWAQSIFVGCLFAIASFLLAYNGYSSSEMVASKVAALAALGVALFPCQCGKHAQLLPGVHAASAAVLFLVLAYFCYGFTRRAWHKGHIEAKARAVIYVLCAIVLGLSILALGIDAATHGELSGKLKLFTTYVGEATGLLAFGVSWLTASHWLPFLSRPDERFSPFRANNPQEEEPDPKLGSA